MRDRYNDILSNISRKEESLENVNTKINIYKNR